MKSAPHAGKTLDRPAVVLLAAGAGSRFVDTCHKLLATLSATDERPAESVFSRTLAHCVAADAGPVTVITGALGEDELSREPAVRALVAAGDVSFRHNPEWADGQSTSVRAAVDVARGLDAGSVVIGLADQPFVTADAWRAVATGLGRVRVATYDGRRGNPVRLHADVWDALPATGDEGARVLFRRQPDLVTEVPCTGSPADIDTVEDLRRWQSN